MSETTATAPDDEHRVTPPPPVTSTSVTADAALRTAADKVRRRYTAAAFIHVGAPQPEVPMTLELTEVYDDAGRRLDIDLDEAEREQLDEDWQEVGGELMFAADLLGQPLACQHEKAACWSAGCPHHACDKALALPPATASCLELWRIALERVLAAARNDAGVYPYGLECFDPERRAPALAAVLALPTGTDAYRLAERLRPALVTALGAAGLDVTLSPLGPDDSTPASYDGVAIVQAPGDDAPVRPPAAP